MITNPRILASSNVNPKDKRVVVVENVDPHKVKELLPDVLIFVQGTDEDFGDTIYSSEEGVLNVLKPNLFICDEPDAATIDLCAKLHCNVSTLEHLAEELRILGKVEVEPSSHDDLITPKEVENFMLDVEEDDTDPDMFYGVHKSQR